MRKSWNFGSAANTAPHQMMTGRALHRTSCWLWVFLLLISSAMADSGRIGLTATATPRQPDVHAHHQNY